MQYQELSDARLVNLARQGDALAWIECLYRGLESRVLADKIARKARP
jgi:hypothetical protein